MQVGASKLIYTLNDSFKKVQKATFCDVLISLKFYSQYVEKRKDSRASSSNVNLQIAKLYMIKTKRENQKQFLAI